MKQFIVDRHTTPKTPTLEQVPTDKIPIYETSADAEADLANLAVGQIIGIEDTGDELAQPVDVVEEDNLHAVTSNAVAESLSYSTTEQKTGGVWIDGKPIYRKVVEFSQEIVLPLDTWVDTPQSNSNIARIINCKGYNNLGACFQVSGAKDQGNYMRLLSERPTNTSLIGFMFEYTKTTD